MDNTEIEVLDQGTEEASEEVEVEETDKAQTSADEDFEYDEDGNIVVPDDDDSEENDEANGADDTETTTEEDEEGAHDDGAAEKATVLEEKGDAVGKNVDAKYSELLERAKDMLEKLGVDKVTDEGVIDAMIKLAAEASDKTPEEYKAEIEAMAEAKREEQRKIDAEFERVSSLDLAELKKIYPELKDVKNVKELSNWEDFGRLRAMGFSAPVAYKMVATPKARTEEANPSSVNKNLGGTKDHLKTATGKTARGGTSMPKSELASWRQMFPEKSDAEIQKLYEKTL